MAAGAGAGGLEAGAGAAGLGAGAGAAALKGLDAGLAVGFAGAVNLIIIIVN